MNILEKEIEEILFETLTEVPGVLQQRGLEIFPNEHYIRQPDLGNYGRPDIVGYTLNEKTKGHRIISITILELKKDEINTNTLLQASRYAVGIEKYLERYKLKDTIIDIDIVLIGKSIDKESDFVFLLSQTQCVKAYTFSIDIIGGLKFKDHSGYFKTKHGFKDNFFSFSSLKSQALSTVSRHRNTQIKSEKDPF